MRDTPYATELKRVEDAAGQRIERLFVKEHQREEIRFSWWKDGKLVVRPLDLPESELLALIGNAIDNDVFSEEFVLGLQSVLSSRLSHTRYLQSMACLAEAARPKRDSLIEYLQRAQPIDEEWPEIDDPPPEPFGL